MNDESNIADPGATASKIAGRPLEGLVIGISVAAGEDSAHRGFTEEEINRTIVRLSDVLLSSGAKLVFGHDWRPGGVMSAVARLAVSYEPRTPVADDQAGRRLCRITNLVPWDRNPELPEDLREDLEKRGMLRIEKVSLPAALAQYSNVFGRRALRAAGLSVLRKRLAELCHARICLGGKFLQYEGFWPGILEEALTSAAREPRRKVLLSGMLGGASAKILQAARSGEWADLVQGNREAELREGFERFRNLTPPILPDLGRAPELLPWNLLQLHSGLSENDWIRLANATDVEVVAALVIKALLRNGNPPKHTSS